MKESRKCDSLKVAYQKKSIMLDSLLQNNLTLFSKLQENQKLQKELQSELTKVNRQIKKKNRSSLVYILGGTTAGIITGFLISK